jgi:NADP-dependent 3-hydroxy acid dehydrogenase YdfG
MSKTIIIVGFGPGVSTAVAERFGAEGLSVALIARSQARLTAGVEALKAKASPPQHSLRTRATRLLSAARSQRSVPNLVRSVSSIGSALSR